MVLYIKCNSQAVLIKNFTYVYIEDSTYIPSGNRLFFSIISDSIKVYFSAPDSDRYNCREYALNLIEKGISSNAECISIDFDKLKCEDGENACRIFKIERKTG